jgi:hypothetical protein
MSATDARKSERIWRQEKMSKSKKEARAKNNAGKGPEQPKLKTAAAAKPKPNRTKSEASEEVWKNAAFRKKITDGIRKYWAQKKAAAAKA